jgi:hypothetical protein
MAALGTVFFDAAVMAFKPVALVAALAVLAPFFLPIS